MPNRILRDGILTSDRVDKIADRPEVEVTYRRLYSVVDDYGLFTAHPSLLRAALYPLRLDKITDAEIANHLAACCAAGLIATYTVAGKPYLEVADFRQQKRAMRSKYPAPAEHPLETRASDATHVRVTGIADDRTCTHPHTRGERREAEARGAVGTRETRDESREAQSEPETVTRVEEFLNAYPKKTKRDAAARAYVSLIETEEEHALLMKGLHHWLESDQWRRSLDKDGGRFVPDPDKFIFERRYMEQPAPYLAGELESPRSGLDSAIDRAVDGALHNGRGKEAA